jgi:hypothetical protein
LATAIQKWFWGYLFRFLTRKLSLFGEKMIAQCTEETNLLKNLAMYVKYHCQKGIFSKIPNSCGYDPHILCGHLWGGLFQGIKFEGDQINRRENGAIRSQRVEAILEC